MSFRQSLTGLLFSLMVGLLPLCAWAQCVNLAIAGGTADALMVPSLPCTPTSTLLILSTPSANQTTSPSLSVNGGPAQTILSQNGQALGIGDITANGKQLLTYNGTNWFLINRATGLALTNAAKFLFVATQGNSGNDAHDCLSAALLGSSGPCATFGHALTVVSQSKFAGPALITGGPGNFQENITVNGGLSSGLSSTGFLNAASQPLITIAGAGGSLTTVQGGNTIAGQSFCSALLANAAAQVALQSIGFTANAAGSSCLQSDIYAQFGSYIFVLGDVKLGPANGFHAFAEEKGTIEVQPGGGIGPGLTFAGNALGAVGLSAHSLFQADTSLVFTGNVYSGEVFDGDSSSNFKLSGNPPSTGSFSGTLFNIAGNTVFETAVVEAWPGTIGFAQTGAVWEGAVSATAVTSQSGTGSTGGTAIVVGADPYHGILILSPSGSGLASSGNFFLSLPYLLVGGACNLGANNNGTGSWGASPGFTFTAGSATPQGTWTNNSTLTGGQTYYESWQCRS